MDRPVLHRGTKSGYLTPTLINEDTIARKRGFVFAQQYRGVHRLILLA
jgi:hypothetical protein